MLKMVSPAEKYDPNYTNESAPVLVGIAALIIWAYFSFMNKMFTPGEWYTYTIPFRIICAIWVHRMSDQQNRDKGWNTFLAFFFPAVTLIITSQLKKLNLAFKIDMDYPPDTQAKELRAYGNSFVKRMRYTEAIVVFTYLIENLPYRENDVNLLAELKKRVEK